MKTVFIGGGQGCREVLELVEQGRLAFLALEVLAVVDLNPDAPGLRFAQSRGWNTLTSLDEALALPGLDLVVELTGADEVLDRVRRRLPPKVHVMDHIAARVFWDLEKLARNLRQELKEKTELQARVARDRAELQEILDTIPDMVAVLDRDMRVRRVNRRFEQITGLSRDEARGRPWDSVFPGEDGEDFAEAFVGPFHKVLETGAPLTLAHSTENPTGEEEHYQITISPIFDGKHQIVGVVHTAMDISEQVMLMRETEESARRFRQIVEAVRGLVVIKDLEGRYQLVNPQAEKVYGLSRDRMIGRKASELFPPEVAEIIERKDREALARGENYATEDNIHLGGRERAMISERFPLTDYKGKVVGLCCVARDYSRRRQLQQELVQTERLAAIGKLAAGVAHELNNPLSGILAFSQDLLLEAEPDDPARGDYEIIVDETLRCRRIVKDLLEFSRQKTPERRRMRLDEVISRVLPLVEKQASFHNIVFDVTLDQDLPEINIDPQQIQQVLLNLVINARDSMQASGSISILGERADGGRSVALSVTDRGSGITVDRLDKIFQPFYSTKGDEGHGLGLAGVQSVVERHGGRIEVESKLGEGSTFRVLFPAFLE